MKKQLAMLSAFVLTSTCMVYMPLQSKASYDVLSDVKLVETAGNKTTVSCDIGCTLSSGGVIDIVVTANEEADATNAMKISNFFCYDTNLYALQIVDKEDTVTELSYAGELIGFNDGGDAIFCDSYDLIINPKEGHIEHGEICEIKLAPLENNAETKVTFFPVGTVEFGELTFSIKSSAEGRIVPMTEYSAKETESFDGEYKYKQGTNHYANGLHTVVLEDGTVIAQVTGAIDSAVKTSSIVRSSDEIGANLNEYKISTYVHNGTELFMTRNNSSLNARYILSERFSDIAKSISDDTALFTIVYEPLKELEEDTEVVVFGNTIPVYHLINKDETEPVATSISTTNLTTTTAETGTMPPQRTVEVQTGLQTTTSLRTVEAQTGLLTHDTTSTTSTTTTTATTTPVVTTGSTTTTTTTSTTTKSATTTAATTTETTTTTAFTTFDLTDDMQAGGVCGDNIIWTLNNDNTLYITGKGAMYSFKSNTSPWHEYRNSIRKIVISEGVTSIGSYAFQSCANLKRIVLPESLIAIGYSAFISCINLSEIELPQNLKGIADYAFANCFSLKEIGIPEGVTEKP